MRIFDGVEVNPTPQTTTRGIQGWLSAGMLLVNSLTEAEKCRQARIGAEVNGIGTLDEVMAQAGLKLPGLEEALAQLMGDGEEARQAASMIVNSPDPTNLLQQFAQKFGLVDAADAKPVVTPPPSGPCASEQAADLLKYRFDFPRQPATAAAPPNGEPPLPKHRPDLTREAREAAKAAAGEGASGSVVGATAPANAPRPSLVAVVERQLNALRQRMKAHEVELDTRLKRAEAELVALREEVQQRARAVVPTVELGGPGVSIEASEPVLACGSPGDIGGEQPAVEPAPTSTEAREHAVETREVAVKQDEPAASSTEAREHDAIAADVASEPAAEPALSPEALPVEPSEGEVVQAIELISEFTEEVDVRHQQGLARVLAVEEEVRVMRAVIRGEAALHG